MKRIITLALLVSATALFLVACSAQQPSPTVTIQMEMSEYAFSPQAVEVKVGQDVTMELVNVGQLEHELMIGRDVMMTNNRPSGYMVDMFATAGVEPMVMGGETEGDDHGAGHQGFMVLLRETNDRATVTFTVTSEMIGEWEMGCFEQDGVHYDAGMKGTFTVVP